MTTIKQIAQIAGVSRGTVDRVLNNRGSVSPDTARRIQEIAEALNYTPSKAALGLNVLKHGIKLGYILFSPDNNPFFMQVEQGLRKKAAELNDYGCSVEIRYIDFKDDEHQDQIIDSMVEDGVAGIALCGFNNPSTAMKIQKLAKMGIPVVTTNTDIPASGRLAYVGSHYESAGRTAARLMDLITGGKAEIGVVLGSWHILCHSSRVDGFRDYLREKAPGLHIVKCVESKDDDILTFSEVQTMLKESPEITGLFLASAGVYDACRAVSMLPPERRPQIICYDCPPTTQEMLKQGIIAAAICQEPAYQGSKPLDILYQRLCMNETPSREYYYTKNEIIVSENA